MRTSSPLCSRLVAKLLSLFLLVFCCSSTVARAQSGCVSGSATCSDTFTSPAVASLTDYSAAWKKVKGTADAYTTGNSTIAINGSNYAYYAYVQSNSDIAQITVSPSSTRNYYAREACVRLVTGGGYCVGFGAVVNGMYSGCFVEKMGSYLSNGSCPNLPATVPHNLALVARGTAPVSLDVFVDGQRTGTITDAVQTIVAGQSGLALIGDGTPANSQIAAWQDYQGTLLPMNAMVPVVTPFACTTGSGSCYDNFQGQMNAALSQYNAAWVRTKGTSTAFLTPNRSLQIPGQAYAYYSYGPSTSDTSQITVSQSATPQAYTREACVRVQQNAGGYCVGFGPVVNGTYGGCFIEESGSYMANVNCGNPSATSSHTLGITATGVMPVVLQVYLDGVPVRAIADYTPLPKAHPGFALVGDGNAANSDMSAWRDYRDLATASAPTFSPAAGTYNGLQRVVLSSATSNATIRYTVDGSSPTALSPVYTGAIAVGASTTVRAMAMVQGQNTSAVSSAAYQINLPAAAAPAFSVPSPYSGVGTLVGIVNAAGPGQIQYCMDTTNTCTPSYNYVSPLSFASTGFIRARALAPGFSPSPIASWQGIWSTVRITTTSCPGGTQYKPYAGCVLSALGGLPPYTYSWSTTSGDGLTEGLALNAQTGLITGTVYGQGIYQVNFSVTDGTNTTVTQTIPLAISANNTLGGCSLFPDDSVWHLNVANLPVDRSPAGAIAAAYRGSSLHLVFGANITDGGIPFLRVPFNQPNVPVSTTMYQSYFTSAPFPAYAPVESTQNATDGDRHTLIIQTGGNGNHCKLWEMWQGQPTGPAGWTDSSNAMWDLESYDMLPQDNGSTDAAGLPVAPLLYNYDEVAGNCAPGSECGEVKHAGRLTLNHTLSYHVWPATAQSGNGICFGGYQDTNRLLSQSNPPSFCSAGTAMGEIQRLKSTTPTPAACTNHPQALVILKAMRNYGLMVVDNGVTGGIVATADSRWNNDDLACLTSLTLNDFEPVDVSSKMVDINSSKVRP